MTGVSHVRLAGSVAGSAVKQIFYWDCISVWYSWINFLTNLAEMRNCTDSYEEQDVVIVWFWYGSFGFLEGKDS